MSSDRIRRNKERLQKKRPAKYRIINLNSLDLGEERALSGERWVTEPTPIPELEELLNRNRHREHLTGSSVLAGLRAIPRDELDVLGAVLRLADEAGYARHALTRQLLRAHVAIVDALVAGTDPVEAVGAFDEAVAALQGDAEAVVAAELVAEAGEIVGARRRLRRLCLAST